MPEINLKAQIMSLSKLQTLDTEIYALRREKESKPAEIKALEDAFQAKKQLLAEAEKALLDLQKQRKDREAELAAKEEEAKKLQTQLFQLKTNKEYQTMLQQIAGTKTDASVIEDKILGVLDQIDASKSDVEKEKLKLQEEEKIFSAHKKEVEARIKEIDDRLAQLEGMRKQVLPEIEEKIISQYERILTNRDGLAIVTVKDFSCGGCNMSVPPQVVNLIRMYERIITCEVCNRILYIGDESR